jgi:5'-3' exonuclease
MFSVLADFDRIRVERFKQSTEDKLRDVRCPEHNQPPRLRFQGNTLRDISISLSGCCAKLMEIANARIGSAWLADTEKTKAS